MFNFSLILIMAVCLAAIFYIVGKKIPSVKVVNSATAKDLKQTEIKKRLLEERFSRHLESFYKKAISFLVPIGKLIGEKIKDLYHLIVEMEEKYRHKALKASFKDRVNKQQFTDKLLQEAASLVIADKLFDAEKKYIEILKLDEMNVEAYKGLGKFYLAKKDYEHAMQTFEFLMKITEDDPFVYRSLGEISSEKGDLKRAEADFQKSLDLDKGDIGTYLDLAEVYLNLDENQKAFDIISQAASIAPNNPKILDFLIEISIIVRDKAAANKAYNQLKEANPENQKLAEFKERISKL